MSQTTLDPIGAVGPDVIPGSKQPRGFLFAYVAAWFGISLVLSTLGGAAIPKVFAFLDDSTKGVNLSIVAAIGGVVVIVITPLFGRLSDRTMSKLGKRRPWILGGALVGMAGVVVLAFSTELWQVIVGWAVVQTAYGATNSAVHALLADQIPTRIRARVSAAASVANALALIVGSLMIAALPNDQQWTWFIVPGVVGTVFSVLLFFRLHDIVRTEKPEPWRWSDVLSTYWLNPVKYRDFFWAWACRLFVTMSLFTVSTYLLFFIIDRLGIPKEEASGVFAMVLIAFTLASILTTVVFGWISDKTGKRKAIVWVSALLSAVGLTVAAVAPDLTRVHHRDGVRRRRAGRVHLGRHRDDDRGAAHVRRGRQGPRHRLAVVPGAAGAGAGARHPAARDRRERRELHGAVHRRDRVLRGRRAVRAAHQERQVDEADAGATDVKGSVETDASSYGRGMNPDDKTRFAASEAWTHERTDHLLES